LDLITFALEEIKLALDGFNEVGRAVEVLDPLLRCGVVVAKVVATDAGARDASGRATRGNVDLCRIRERAPSPFDVAPWEPAGDAAAARCCRGA
jgi:hypothetical protein